MKKNILKIGFLSLLSIFVLFSCYEDDGIVVQEVDKTLVMNDPGANLVTLDYANPNNPAFTLSWDDAGVAGDNTYTIAMSPSEDFETRVELGTSDTYSFSMTHEQMNSALTAVSAEPYNEFVVYFRAENGDQVSNVVRIVFVPFATEVPVIDPAVDGLSLTLDVNTPDMEVATVSWSDFDLSGGFTDVTYMVEAAAAGTNFATIIPAGTVENMQSITWSHSQLNDVAILTGIAGGETGMIDLRVKATINNGSDSGLESVRYSEPVTITVTTYSTDVQMYYLVGAATAPGWSNDNNNPPLFYNPSTNSYYYSGYFNADAFKVLEMRGAWQPQWGTNDGTTLAVNPGGGSDPNVFSITGAAGYYTFTFQPVGESGSFDITSYTGSTATTYSTIGIIGDATPGGWGSDTDMTQSTFDPHIWYTTITLTDGELKFRANDDWADNWGADSELYGMGTPGGPNIPATAGTYEVWFNDLDGSYILIAQ